MIPKLNNSNRNEYSRLISAGYSPQEAERIASSASVNMADLTLPEVQSVNGGDITQTVNSALAPTPNASYFASQSPANMATLDNMGVNQANLGSYELNPGEIAGINNSMDYMNKNSPSAVGQQSLIDSRNSQSNYWNAAADKMNSFNYEGAINTGIAGITAGANIYDTFFGKGNDMRDAQIAGIKSNIKSANEANARKASFHSATKSAFA